MIMIPANKCSIRLEFTWGFIVTLKKKRLKDAYILSKCRRIWRTISTVRRRARWYRNGRNRSARRASSLCVSRTPVTRSHLAWFIPFWSHWWTKRPCFMSHPLERHLIFFCYYNNTLKNRSDLGSLQRKMAKKRDLFCCLLPLTIFSRLFPASLPDCLRQVRAGRGRVYCWVTMPNAK